MPYLKKCQEYFLYTKAFNVQGIAYSELGNDMVAMEYYLDGLESVRENHLPDLQVWFYNNIGSRFQEAGEHEDAIVYLDKARKYLSVGKRKERFPYLVLLILYMNLGNSYTHTGQYEKAEETLQIAIDIARENEDESYGFPLMVLESALYWKTDRKEWVYEHLDEMMDMVAKGEHINDYTQNITECAELLTDMKEFAKLNILIELYEKYAEAQKSNYLKIIAMELRLSYAEELGDEERYQEYALEYTLLSLEQKKKVLKGRAGSMKMRIELKEREIERRQAQIREEKLKQKSEKDALTGIGNRYSLERYSKSLITHALKEQNHLCVGIMDIDCFKEYNDTYGHLEGDKCLAQVASIIEEKTGDKGKCFRYGGDEFVVVMENMDMEEAETLGTEIKEAMRKLSIPHMNSNVEGYVTLSQGYACLKVKKRCTLHRFFECADAALYSVKEAGKNNFMVVECTKCQ